MGQQNNSAIGRVKVEPLCDDLAALTSELQIPDQGL